MSPRGDSLLVSDGRGGQTIFGFVKRSLVYLWVRYLVHNWYILELMMRKIDKVIARLSFSAKYRSGVAENAIKPLVFMLNGGMSIFLGSKMS